MKAIKFTITALLLSLIFSFSSYASGTEAVTMREETTEEGLYVEIITTVLSERTVPLRKAAPAGRLLMAAAPGLSQSKTVNRTLNVRDASGNTLWYLSLNATFIYNGSSSECISCSQSAGSNAQSWSIKSSSCSRSGNYAIATATAVHKLLIMSQEYTQSVTISCGPNGDVY